MTTFLHLEQEDLYCLEDLDGQLFIDIHSPSNAPVSIPLAGPEVTYPNNKQPNNGPSVFFKIRRVPSTVSPDDFVRARCGNSSLSNTSHLPKSKGRQDFSNMIDFSASSEYPVSIYLYRQPII